MKRLIGVLTYFLCALNLMAQSVTKELATQIAEQYMQYSDCQSAPKDYSLLTRNSQIDSTYTQTFSITGKAPLYLVQLPEGWVLVASEFVTTPILASAPTGQFPDTINMPDGMKWLLSYYEDALRYTRDSLSIRKDSIINEWEYLYAPTGMNNRNISSLPSNYEINSIRSFLWNQNGNNGTGVTNCNKVYNKFCPTWHTPSCGHTYVGCTAVAMGIVMRYYKWPHSAIIPDTIDSLAHISAEKHIVTYNWNNMPGTIYNSTSISKVDEIAGFLRDCGYAAKMKYRSDGSGASFDNAEYAMEHNFHYANVTHRHRNWYVGNWVNKLKTEIAADRPVIYAGYTDSVGGHTFVLYGYDTDDKFIINWGWADTTVNNGVYTLNPLIPNGSNEIENYYKDQEAIWGIMPDYPTCSSTEYALTQSEVNENLFEIYKGGAIIASNITIQDGHSGGIFSGESVTLTSGFQINAGAEVYIGIKDMHCDDDRGEITIGEEIPEIHHAPQHQGTIATPSATKILRDGQILIRRDGKTYTIQGQEVK